VKEHQTSNSEKESPLPGRRFAVEDWILIAGLAGFIIFFWIILFLFFPLLANRPYQQMLPQAIVDMAATRGFVLPPTWTPGPTQEFIPTPMATQVYDGTIPTRVYTPRPTSLSAIFLPQIPPRGSVIELARILQGESPGDREAAYYVGWVAKNRLLHPGYGDDYITVSHGFFGYRADMQPSEEFLDLARRVIRAKEDPTGGCLYALSRTDITKLGVPPSRADITIGEWFFFKTWPVVSNRRR
jgi:hypothetical protein